MRTLKILFATVLSLVAFTAQANNNPACPVPFSSALEFAQSVSALVHPTTGSITHQIQIELSGIPVLRIGTMHITRASTADQFRLISQRLLFLGSRLYAFASNASNETEMQALRAAMLQVQDLFRMLVSQIPNLPASESSRSLGRFAYLDREYDIPRTLLDEVSDQQAELDRLVELFP